MFKLKLLYAKYKNLYICSLKLKVSEEVGVCNEQNFRKVFNNNAIINYIHQGIQEIQIS